MGEASENCKYLKELMIIFCFPLLPHLFQRLEAGQCHAGLRGSLQAG